MPRSHRPTHNARRGKKPALVTARELLRATLGSSYELRVYPAAGSGRRFEVLRWEHCQDHGVSAPVFITAGTAPNPVVREAIRLVRR